MMPYTQIDPCRSRSALRSALAGACLALGTLALPQAAHAQQPYVGEVACGGWNFCPVDWANCDGRLMDISQYSTLFNLIGTTYGGDGQSTFALPNIQGRTMVGTGTNPGTGSTYQLAQQAGVEAVTLTTQQIPQHSHPLMANGGAEKSASPVGKILGVSPASAKVFSSGAAITRLPPGTLGSVGQSLPHSNVQPYLAVTCCISLFGVYPSQ